MIKNLQKYNNLFKDLDKPEPSRFSCAVWLFLILAVTVLAYLPALSGEFLNFDDHRFYNHPAVTDFNIENLKKVFFMQDTDLLFTFNWLSLITFQINWFISPSYLGFVSFAIFCHLLQTIFFWKICRKLSKTFALTVLSTAIFSLHPLHPNHIVWQAIRWHLLAVTFCLFSTWCYLNSLDENKSQTRKIINYAFAVLGYFVIVFGRPYYIIYPLILIVVDLLRRKPFSAMLVFNKLPFIILALVDVLFAHRSGQVTSRIASEWMGGSFFNTLLTDLNLNLEYFRQLFIPSHITLVVPINEATGLWSTIGCSDLFLLKLPPIISLTFFVALLASFLWLWRRFKLPIPLILLLGIFVTLIHVQNIPPKRGIAGVFAYRYAVSATVFASPLIAMMFISLYKKFSCSKILSSIILCSIFGYVLCAFNMTLQNVDHFKNSENLWSHHLKMLPNSRAGYYYLGKVYHFIHKDPYSAISAYQKALDCPHYWGAGAIDQRLAQAYIDIQDWENAHHAMSRINPRTVAKSARLKKMKASILKNLRSTETVITSPQQISNGNQKVILFDLVHSVRHSPFSEYTKDSIEYNVVQGYGRLQQYLRELGFEVQDHNAGRLTPEVLKKVDVLMIGLMSYEALPMNTEEIETIIEYVRNGGGLHLVSDHTNAYDNANLANRLLRHFDIEVLDALIVDKTARKDSWYSPKTFSDHPVTKGISLLVHQAGTALATEHGVAFTDPQAWADRGNPDNGIGRFGNKLFETGEEKKAYPVIAARNYGKGRIVVTTDCNLYANAWIFSFDNFKLVRNTFSWLAQIPPVQIPSSPNDILIHEAHPAYFRTNWSKEVYYSFYVNFGHIDSVRAYLSPKLTFDKKVLLMFDRVDLSENSKKRLDSYLRQGGTLVYLCTEKAFQKQRTELLDYFDIKFSAAKEDEISTEYIQVTGDSSACKNVFQLPWIPSIKTAGAIPVVYGDDYSQKIYIMKKKVGMGEIYVVPFKKIFKTKYMGTGTSSRNPNMRQQQIRRLQENLIHDIIEDK